MVATVGVAVVVLFLVVGGSVVVLRIRRFWWLFASAVVAAAGSFGSLSYLSACFSPDAGVTCHGGAHDLAGTASLALGPAWGLLLVLLLGRLWLRVWAQLEAGEAA